ncbi:MAG: gfo/Idh/MocA family oxidoreductase [Phycisphaera sp.]|nr:gfo/Idh/MocA family oxidoreductase [Phycisphaera sp.]
MSTIRIGSIGAGGRGGVCQHAHRPEQGIELAAICDTNPQVIERYRKRYGDHPRATDDWHQLLEWDDLDVVFVTTPDYLHERQAVAALERGKTVFLEKPMAITLEGCDRILQTMRRHNGRLFVGHNMRYFPVIRKMKQWIDEGRIGEVQAVWCRHFVDYGGDAYFKDWHSERKNTTGLLLQKGAHDIDVIHHLADSHTVRTVGMGRLGVYDRVTDRRTENQRGDASFNLDHWPPLSQTGLSPTIDVEDHSMMLMQLANGVQASYCQCHFSPDGWRNYTVIGTEGRIENTGDHSQPGHWATVHLWNKRCGPSALQGQIVETVPPITGSHGGADPQMIDAFVEFIRTGQHAGATPLDARNAVAAGYLATLSLRQGNRPFDVPEPNLG